MSDKKTILKSIINQGALPLFYSEDATVSLEVTRALYKAGIRAVEYTNRGAAALDNFSRMKETLSAEFPDLYLGIGTIKTKGEAKSFIKAGADFIVQPIMNKEVAEAAEKAELLWVPGCMTPTEIFHAQQHEAELIKLFPGNLLGASFLHAIRELFPGQAFMPTGGVELKEESIGAWFKAGVCAVGLGSALITRDIIQKKDYELLYSQTVTALQIIDAVRGVGK